MKSLGSGDRMLGSRPNRCYSAESGWESPSPTLSPNLKPQFLLMTSGNSSPCSGYLQVIVKVFYERVGYGKS